jgi:hypothetical protein
MIRARQALSNGALVAKFGFDTAENKPQKGRVLGSFFLFFSPEPAAGFGEQSRQPICV